MHLIEVLCSTFIYQFLMVTLEPRKKDLDLGTLLLSPLSLLRFSFLWALSLRHLTKSNRGEPTSRKETDQTTLFDQTTFLVNRLAAAADHGIKTAHTD